MSVQLGWDVRFRGAAAQSRGGDARGVMLRLLQIALALSTVIAAVLVVGRHRLPLVFTRDRAVAQLVASVLPLLAACMVRYT